MAFVKQVGRRTRQRLPEGMVNTVGYSIKKQKYGNRGHANLGWKPTTPGGPKRFRHTFKKRWLLQQRQIVVGG